MALTDAQVLKLRKMRGAKNKPSWPEVAEKFGISVSSAKYYYWRDTPSYIESRRQSYQKWSPKRVFKSRAQTKEPYRPTPATFLSRLERAEQTMSETEAMAVVCKAYGMTIDEGWDLLDQGGYLEDE
jgi:hypothetical protein